MVCIVQRALFKLEEEIKRLSRGFPAARRRDVERRVSPHRVRARHRSHLDSLMFMPDLKMEYCK